MLYELLLILCGVILSILLIFAAVVYLIIRIEMWSTVFGQGAERLSTRHPSNTHDTHMHLPSKYYHTGQSSLRDVFDPYPNTNGPMSRSEVFHAGWVRVKMSYIFEDGFEDFPAYCCIPPQHPKQKKKFSTPKKSIDMSASISSESKTRSTSTISKLGSDSSKDHQYYKYVVLKSRSLFVYSSDRREHCDGIIVLTKNCSIKLLPEKLIEEEYFCKQYPIQIVNHEAPILGSSHTCYLYAVNASEKEDWYRGLLSACNDSNPCKPDVNNEDGPQPMALQYEEIYQESHYIRHIRDIQSPLLDQGTQWFNALLARIFLNVSRSKGLEQTILNKLNRKTSRLRKPFFVGDILVKEVTIGDSLPLISKCQLHSFEPSGEVNVSCDLLYTGGFRVQVETTAKIDIPKMKPIIIPLVLAIIVKRVYGRVLLRIKPPPTDRIWIGFYGLPEMDLKIEPIVSTRSINFSMVHSIIYKRIEDVVLEFLVLPTMDDWVIPFADEGMHESGPLVTRPPNSDPETHELTSFQNDAYNLSKRQPGATSLPSLLLDSFVETRKND
jgi:hypothetical protein